MIANDELLDLTRAGHREVHDPAPGGRGFLRREALTAEIVQSSGRDWLIVLGAVKNNR